MKKQIVKEVESFSVDIAANGFVIDYTGRSEDDDWISTKQVVNNMEELVNAIHKICTELAG